MKRYLLAAGDNYYPNSPPGDWIDFFDSYDEAKEEVEQMMDGPKYKDSYKIRDKFYDWYEIIDLLNWKEHI
jgi:hypothetical protein